VVVQFRFPVHSKFVAILDTPPGVALLCAANSAIDSADESVRAGVRRCERLPSIPRTPWSVVLNGASRCEAK
jgi:hypothetical protein